MVEPRGGAAELDRLLSAAKGCRNLIVFSGSGLSAPAGMSTFSTKGGLYEKAARRFGIQDGKHLFSYAFFEKRRLEALAFFADIYTEAVAAVPAAGHRALADIAALGCLRRHYTLNIDGLGEAAGMDTWHPDTNPDGVTVEMHGSIRQLVCPMCGHVVPMAPPALNDLKASRPVACSCCGHAPVRIRVMLYDDAEDDVITPETVFDAMETDMAVADMVVWVGISFQQSASTHYFRRVRGLVAEAGRLGEVRQVIVNPSDEALWNLLSACSNTEELEVLEVLLTADAALPPLAARLAVGTPHAARLARKAEAAAAAMVAAAAAATLAHNGGSRAASRRGVRATATATAAAAAAAAGHTAGLSRMAGPSEGHDVTKSAAVGGLSVPVQAPRHVSAPALLHAATPGLLPSNPFGSPGSPPARTRAAAAAEAAAAEAAAAEAAKEEVEAGAGALLESTPSRAVLQVGDFIGLDTLLQGPSKSASSAPAALHQDTKRLKHEHIPAANSTAAATLSCPSQMQSQLQLPIAASDSRAVHVTASDRSTLHGAPPSVSLALNGVGVSPFVFMEPPSSRSVDVSSRLSLPSGPMTGPPTLGAALEQLSRNATASVASIPIRSVVAQDAALAPNHDQRSPASETHSSENVAEVRAQPCAVHLCVRQQADIASLPDADHERPPGELEGERPQDTLSICR